MDWQTAGVIATTIVATLTAVRLLAGGSWNLSGRIATIESSVVAIQNEIKRLADVLVSIADMKGDMRVIDTRLSNAEQDIRDLQRGEGMVIPLNKSPYEKP